MKKRLLAFARCILAALLLLPCVITPALAAEPPEIQEAAGAYLYNFENDTVLFELNPDERIYPASTVKLMTGILAMEALGEDPDRSITVTAEMLNKVVGNNMGLKVGEVVTAKDMLYGLLLNGANDAAQVLAVTVSGSVEDFVDAMNDKAQMLGAYNTFYTNPTGMHSDAMITTVADTAAIAKYACSLPGFTEITSLSKYVMEATNKSDYRNLYNRNGQISRFYEPSYLYSGSLGLNAGYTKQSGYCLVSVARRDELSYLCVIMNAGSDENEIYSYANAKALLNFAFDSYGYVEVLSEKQRICELPVSLSSTVDYVTLVPAESIIRYLPTDYDPDQLQIAYSTYAEALEAPIHEGTVYGNVAVYYEGEVVGTAELISTASVTRSEFLHLLKQIRDFTSSRFFRATIVFIILFSVAYVLFEAHRREMQIRRRF